MPDAVSTSAITLGRVEQLSALWRPALPAGLPPHAITLVQLEDAESDADWCKITPDLVMAALPVESPVHHAAGPRPGASHRPAAACHQRWEIELIFDELKTHQRGPRLVLRSKAPDLVQQEIWGHLCCHYAIRTLMADVAQHSRHDPDRMSFVAALRIAPQPQRPPNYW